MSTLPLTTWVRRESVVEGSHNADTAKSGEDVAEEGRSRLVRAVAGYVLATVIAPAAVTLFVAALLG